MSTPRQGKMVVSIPSPRGPVLVGGGHFALVAGPCSVDRAETFFEAADGVRELGVQGLRGAVYKMRTRPDAFQGLGREGFDLLREARQRTGLPIFTEVVDPRHLEELEDIVDVYQVGARNMYNYELLKELGRLRKPVLLKRAFTAYLEEWAAAAEYIQRGGNSQVILCERGVRGFDPGTRNILDLASIALIRERTGLPVVVDPSHGTGHASLVEPMSLAAVAAGADGLLIEVHPRPEVALSDAHQALTLPQFARLSRRISQLRKALSEGAE